MFCEQCCFPDVCEDCKNAEIAAVAADQRVEELIQVPKINIASGEDFPLEMECFA